ncbi:MAG: DUF1499 domain-containing protein [Pseudomonadota bacterium]
MTHALAPLWERIGGPADTGPVDFPALHAKTRPNRYLVAPPGLAPDADVDAPSPAFAVGVAALRDAFRVAIFAEPNAQFVASEGAQDRYIVRSRLFGFPDSVVAEFISLSSPFEGMPTDETSTLAVISRSRVGHSDLGANKARVQRVLGRLTDRLPTIEPLAS